MSPEELKERVQNLTIWKKNGQRAPHKPLLILYALGRLQAEGKQHFPYEEVRGKLKEMLVEFGPSRKSYHPEQPFARLPKDGIWQLNFALPDDEKISDRLLLQNEAVGYFPNEVYSLLVHNDKLIQEITEILLFEHFPPTLHEDILTEVGLSFDTRTYKPRDPHFREKILKAYEYSCAVCGFNVRVGRNLVGIEAAHIQWHQAGGPDCEENGIALCSMHHKLFDYGAFTLTEKRELLVAEQAYGTQGFEEWLMRFHGKPIRSAIHPDYRPRDMFIKWHVREVFKGPARYKVNGL